MQLRNPCRCGQVHQCESDRNLYDLVCIPVSVGAGYDKRNGLIRQKILSRQLMKSFDSNKQ